MCLSVVWIDQENAKLFHFSEDSMRRETISASRVDHDEIAGKLGSTRRVLILGPGDARTRLHERLREKFPEIAKRVVACEQADHPSDPQIAALAIKYFQKPVA